MRLNLTYLLTTTTLDTVTYHLPEISLNLTYALTPSVGDLTDL